jgi:uncharacterized membrane protein HdeD (DUF308 family)
MTDSAHVRPFTDPELVAARDRSWGGVLLFGVASVVLGALIGLRPRATIDGVAIILGLFLVANGLFRVVTAVADSDGSTTARGLTALVGLLSTVIGVLFLRETNRSVATLAFLIGLFWLVGGVIEVISAAARLGTPGNRFRLVMGVIGTAAGVVTLVMPSITLVTLAAIVGVWLIAYGLLQVATALVLRKLTSSVR